MNNEFVLSVSLAHELEIAFARNEYTSVQVRELTKGDFLGRVRQVLLKSPEIKDIFHVIDCDADPLIPKAQEWTVEEHRKGGRITWNPSKVGLYLSEFQRNCRDCTKSVEGYDLQKCIVGQRVLNANVLDYLLEHPYLIPQEWKDRLVFFWGTVYKGADGRLRIRCLYWRSAWWDWYHYCLDHGWNDRDPAAVATD